MTWGCPAPLRAWLATSKAPAGPLGPRLCGGQAGDRPDSSVSSVTCSGRAPAPSPLAACARTCHPAALSVHPGRALTQGFQRNRSLPAPPPEPSSGLDATASARSSPGATSLSCVMPGRFLHLSEPQFPVCEMGRAAVPASQSGGTDLQEQVDGVPARGSTELYNWLSPTIRVLGGWGRSAGTVARLGVPNHTEGPQATRKGFRERDSKGEKPGQQVAGGAEGPPRKVKDSGPGNQASLLGQLSSSQTKPERPDAPLPGKEARPPFLQRHPPTSTVHLSRPGLNHQPVESFQLPPTPRLHSCVRMSWGGVCLPRAASPQPPRSLSDPGAST